MGTHYAMEEARLMINTSEQVGKDNVQELVQEFKSALESEIKAVRNQASSSAVSISNGRKTSENMNQFQYKFMFDSLINTPEGSPVNLIVEKQNPIEASIISVAEPYVTLYR